MAPDDPLLQRLVSEEAIQFGDFTLTSGRKSPYYVDIKRATTDPRTLRLVADRIAPAARDCHLVAGMELGAVPLAVAVALAADRPFVMVRKAARTHGTGRRIEGPDVTGKHVLVVEDVATSGGSAVETVQVLRAAGAVVTDCWVVVDREEGGRAALANEDVALHALVSARDLLVRAPKRTA